MTKSLYDRIAETIADQIELVIWHNEPAIKRRKETVNMTLYAIHQGAQIAMDRIMQKCDTSKRRKHRSIK